MLAGLDEWIAGNDHVEFYWYPYTDRAQLKRNNRVPADDRPLSQFRGWLDDEFLSNTVFEGGLPARPGGARHGADDQRGRRPSADRADLHRPVRPGLLYAAPGALHRDGVRDPARRPAGGDRRRCPGSSSELPFKVQFPVEVRFTGPDDVWLSHGYGRESAYVAVHQFTGSPYEPYFRAFEAVCQPLGGRPHWGKLHYRTAEDLRPVYEKFDDFVAVRDRLDPARVFTNDYLDRVLGS